jgi:serine phosphatase RsbU (regulator of sigma subunit)
MRKIIFLRISFILVSSVFFFSSYAQQKAISVDELIESTKTDTAKFHTLLQLSQEYKNTAPNKAFDFAMHALVLATNISYKKGIALANNNLGDLYWYKYDFVSSESYYVDGFKIFNKINDSAGIADGYRNMGWIYFYKNENIEALECHKKSLKINQQLKSKKNAGQNFNDIATCYLKLGLEDSAMYNYCQAMDIQQELDNKNELSAIYGNIGQIYSKMGVSWLAIDNALTSLKYAEEVDNKIYLADIYATLSDFYKKDQNYDVAINFIELSIKASREMDNKTMVNLGYTAISELYALQGNYDKALEYNLLSQRLSDSVYNEANERLYFEMLKNNESENKLLKIQNLKKDKEITEQKLSQGKKVRLYLLGFGIFVAGFAIFLMRNNKQRERINLELTKVSTLIKEKNEEIMDSIAYSKRIQDVCLPSEELRTNLFNNSFIFFRPKDIVSGDFYWYTEKDGKRIIACCDCTGHGVPGALMSMIGINSLNRIVNGKGITSTDEILLTLHHEISKTLKQDDQVYINDGIDVSIVCFNSENEIEYSGANSPLCIVRKDANNLPQLIEIEPDRLSVGIINTDEIIKYTKQRITLQKEDCIYLFSDGIFDQFGGPEGKKYGSGGLRKLLIQLASYSPEEQRRFIAEEMNQWIAKTEQIDDISVIGIKI